MASRDAQEQNIVENITGLVSAFFDVIQKQAKLFQLEFKLAKESFLIILLLGITLFILLMSGWLAFLGVIAFLLHIFLNSWLMVTSIVLIVNLMVMGITLKAIIGYLENLRFSHTRKHLMHWRTYKHDEDTTIKETN